MNATQQWSTFNAPFANWEDWQYAGATEDQYLSDLSSINWIGVYVYRNTGDDQIYGLDDCMLMVPEPAELMMLAVALAAAWWSLRRRRMPAEVRVTVSG